MDYYDDQPIKPLICPRCGDRVEFCYSGRLICWRCGELVYDPEHRIWDIREFKDIPKRRSAYDVG